MIYLRITRLETVVLRPSGLEEVSMSNVVIAVSLKVTLCLGVKFWARSLQSLEPAIIATTLLCCASFKVVMIILSKRLYFAPLMAA